MRALLVFLDNLGENMYLSVKHTCIRQEYTLVVSVSDGHVRSPADSRSPTRCTTCV